VIQLNTITISNNLRKAKRTIRRGFNLVEMLIALAITGALLSATMVALDASFMAYQTTTEVASTHTISRLIMNRMLTLIRTGQEFGPFPINPQDSIVVSNEIQFFLPDENGNLGDLLTLTWNSANETLFVTITDAGGDTTYPLLEGVTACQFTMEYELGRILHRATIDMTIVPDDNMSVSLDGVNIKPIRLVASAMPRATVYR